MYLKQLVTFCFLQMAITLVAGNLESGFKNPPNSAHPQTWWHWIDGNITREGIAADLAAMKKIGIGGATIIDVSAGLPKGNIRSLSPEWYALVKICDSRGQSTGN